MMNENTNNSLQCEIVKDLLPLYHDEIVSDVTKDAVKFHLDGCPNCTAEYQSICESLPYEKDEQSAKNKYNKMIKKLTLKKILWGITVFASTLAIVGIIAYLLLMVPIIPVNNENISVIKAYKFEDEDEDKFLLIYSVPQYITPTSWNPQISYENGTAIIDIDMKHTIISPSAEALVNSWSWDRVFVLEQDCQTIKLGDEIIWDEEKDGNATIPEYVWEFDNEEVRSRGYAGDYSTFNFHYTDGRIVYWNIEGEKIYDEYPDENGDYPPFPTN